MTVDPHDPYLALISSAVATAIVMGTGGYFIGRIQSRLTSRPQSRRSVLVLAATSLGSVLTWTCLRWHLENIPGDAASLMHAIDIGCGAMIIFAGYTVGSSEGQRHTDVSHREYLMQLYRQFPEDDQWVDLPTIADWMHAKSARERNRLVKALADGQDAGYLAQRVEPDAVYLTLTPKARWQILGAER